MNDIITSPEKLTEEAGQMQEIFKDVKGYEGFYQISNFGRVKSIERQVWNAHNQCYCTRKEMILKPSINPKGYPHVTLYNGGTKTIKVHQLVAMTFLDHIPCGHKIVVDHVDFCKTNNHLSNLRLITTRENTDRKHLKSSSKHTGVYWFKRAKKWRAMIYINGKNKHIGLFPNELDASKAYETALYKLQNEGLK